MATWMLNAGFPLTIHHQYLWKRQQQQQTFNPQEHLPLNISVHFCFRYFMSTLNNANPLYLFFRSFGPTFHFDEQRQLNCMFLCVVDFAPLFGKKKRGNTFLFFRREILKGVRSLPASKCEMFVIHTCLETVHENCIRLHAIRVVPIDL